ncbi:MAG: DinB family protein [Hamadaea sp.]|nr:DinB family protein [Hamadaea sp.]
MDLDLAAAEHLLTRTPDVVAALLGGLPDAWLHRDDGPGTWSAYAILGHLTYADATNWRPRIRMIREHGAGRVFQPFDREAMLRDEPEAVDVLLERFRAGRDRTLADLALDAGELDRVGSHPEFGEVTMRQVVAAWVAHDLTHLGQMAEVLARRHRLDVGPYRRYLPALDRVAEAE